MSHAFSVKRIAQIIRSAGIHKPVLLLGAGASVTSGVPMATRLAELIVRDHVAEFESTPSILPEDVTVDKWHKWLADQKWFEGNDKSSWNERLSANFPNIVENLLKVDRERMTKLRSLLQPSKISMRYYNLAEIMRDAHISTVLTTNFDGCLLASLMSADPLSQITEVNQSKNDFEEFDPASRLQIIWLHGKLEKYTDRNTKAETEALNPALAGHVKTLLDNSALIVIGYRGAEKSIMKSILLNKAGSSRKYRNGIYWCHLAGESFTPNVQALKHQLGNNFEALEIQGFDELMEDIWWNLFIGTASSRSVTRFRLDRMELVKLIVYDKDLQEWHYGDLSQITHKQTPEAFCFTNTAAIWTHNKICLDKLITGDFEIEIEIRGNYVLEIQAADLSDRNFNFNPNEAARYHKFDKSQYNTFLIKRKGRRLKIAHIINDRYVTLLFYDWYGDLTGPCFFDVALHNDWGCDIKNLELRVWP